MILLSFFQRLASYRYRFRAKRYYGCSMLAMSSMAKSVKLVEGSAWHAHSCQSSTRRIGSSRRYIVCTIAKILQCFFAWQKQISSALNLIDIYYFYLRKSSMKLEKKHFLRSLPQKYTDGYAWVKFPF